MPPEYTKHGKISPKLDAFSFGVCLLEMLSGRRATEDLLELFDAHTDRKDLPAVLDPRLVELGDWVIKDVQKVSDMAISLQDNLVRRRPTVKQVLPHLEKLLKHAAKVKAMQDKLKKK